MAKREKAEKPIIRKCHKCGRPLDEDKDFCLHCGETYQEKVKEKKPVNKKLIKKITIIACIVLVLAIIGGIIAMLIVNDMNESRYERMVDYIKDKGERVTIDAPTSAPVSSSTEESSSEEGADDGIEDESSAESESSTEDESSTESATPSEIEIYKLKLDDETYLYCKSDARNSFYLCREVLTMEYHLDDYEKPVDERRIVGQFELELEVYISEASPELCPWTASVAYDSYAGYQGYDFVRSYTGSMKPYDFTYVAGALKPDKLHDDAFVNPFDDVYSLYAELEGIELEMMLEDIISSMESLCFELDEDNSKIIPLLETAIFEMNEMLANEEIVDDYIRIFMADATMKSFNDAYYKLYPEKAPVVDEEAPDAEGDEAVSQELSIFSVTLMASTSSSGEEKSSDEPQGEEGTGEEGEEDEGPKLPPSQEILIAAIEMLSEEACIALDVFGEYLEDNYKAVRVKVGEVGFVKYQEYLDSLIVEKR